MIAENKSETIEAVSGISKEQWKKMNMETVWNETLLTIGANLQIKPYINSGSLMP